MLFISRLFLFLAFGLASVMAQTQGVGTLFNFVPGLGACGFTNTSQQIVASVSRTVFENYKGAGKNPNENPICHHQLVIKSGPKNITASIVDFYVNNKTTSDVGLSKAGFVKFGDVNDGIVANVTWSIT